MEPETGRTLDLNREVLAELQAIVKLKLRSDLTGAAVTTISIGGGIPFFAEPENEPELIALLRVLANFRLPYRVLGAGSNLLIDDRGVEQWVIRLGRGFRFANPVGQNSFVVGASMSLMTLARELSEAGLSGLEFAGGIPASVGGAVRMNAGAHGSEIESIIESVQGVSANGELMNFSRHELNFSYRKSELPADFVVTAVRVSLVSSTREATESLRRENLEHRKRYQPLTLPSAGSIFKNPPGEVSAGKLIEQAGLRGHSIGGASVSELHGNWIVNRGRRATAADVLGLINLCRSTVEERSGVLLETELVQWRYS